LVMGYPQARQEAGDYSSCERDLSTSYPQCAVRGARLISARVATQRHPRSEWMPGERRSSAAAELRGDLCHLVVQRATLLHELADLLVRVHDRGVIAIAEELTDLRQRQTRAFATQVHRDLARCCDLLRT